MRLLFVSSHYPPYDLGGLEQWCQEVATRLQERGHTVQILTSRHGIQAGSHPSNGVLRSLHCQADIYYYRPVDFFLKRAAQERANARELRRVIEWFSPDLAVVWGMWNLSRNVPHWLEQWMPGRVAYYIASYWPIDEDIHEAYWRPPARRSITELIKRPLRHVTLSQLRREGYPPQLRFEHAMCCSRYVRDTLVEAGQLFADAQVLYGGIDPAPFLAKSCKSSSGEGQPLRLLYFGSLLVHKGVHTAIESIALLKTRGLAEGIELVILGSGHPDYERRLRQMVRQLDIGERVRFVGRVPRHEVPSWLVQFDVFLCTSIWPEPMARAVMEAMAAGALVIGSEVGGQLELLADGRNGLTFPAGNAEALADRIARVLEHPSLRQQLASAGQETVLERFTLERMVIEMEATLQELAGRNCTGDISPRAVHALDQQLLA
jgi:glycosyltransferase involved in cell wall biosynthesis